MSNQYCSSHGSCVNHFNYYFIWTSFHIFEMTHLLSLDKYGSAYGSGGQSQMYTYFHEQDDSSFQLVDSSRPQRPLYNRPRGRQMQVQYMYMQLLCTLLSVHVCRVTCTCGVIVLLHSIFLSSLSFSLSFPLFNRLRFVVIVRRERRGNLVVVSKSL